VYLFVGIILGMSSTQWKSGGSTSAYITQKRGDLVAKLSTLEEQARCAMETGEFGEAEEVRQATFVFS
jgi:hypothetical protein